MRAECDTFREDTALSEEVTTAEAATADVSTGTTASPMVQISRIASETIIVPIVGTMPLIMNKFSEKAKRMMLDKMQGKHNPKENRDPEADYEAAIYRMGEARYGFPVTAFKAATVGAARFYGKDVKMTELRQFMWFHGQLTDYDPQALVEIFGEPKMREDVVRLAGASRPADLRYRPEFSEWRAELEITYVTSGLSRDSVISLVEAGGMGVGVGEWRPEKRGDFGTYRVDPDKEIVILS